MLPAIKSEFRKLVTIRSTYLIISFAIAVLVLFAFYITGWKISPQDLNNSGTLASQTTAAVSLLAAISALIGVLHLAHEYRYNTIMYTLTASKNRTRVLFAKIITLSIFAIAFSLFFAITSPLLTVLAVHLHGHTLAPQNIPYLDLLWRAVFYGWGYMMLALILTSIIRVQVGAIAALFLIPGTVEQLLGLLLKKNQAYLPFSSLSDVIDKGTITHTRALLVASMYIVAGWAIAWYLFVRRDAN